ncbi:hypothetical protein [Paraflavitalea speifideaquila]|uniref:hypothetical protein n=1 Tax=Paraflavitalea speifideaquila TaxID=3076558 RepID=UPI0028EC83C8|nr:hypothetical protein [Paraflavitalea speifideiaquila]
MLYCFPTSGLSRLSDYSGTPEEKDSDAILLTDFRTFPTFGLFRNAGRKDSDAVLLTDFQTLLTFGLSRLPDFRTFPTFGLFRNADLL